MPPAPVRTPTTRPSSASSWSSAAAIACAAAPSTALRACGPVDRDDQVRAARARCARPRSRHVPPQCAGRGRSPAGHGRPVRRRRGRPARARARRPRARPRDRRRRPGPRARRGRPGLGDVEADPLPGGEQLVHLAACARRAAARPVRRCARRRTPPALGAGRVRRASARTTASAAGSAGSATASHGATAGGSTGSRGAAVELAPARRSSPPRRSRRSAACRRQRNSETPVQTAARAAEPHGGAVLGEPQGDAVAVGHDLVGGHDRGRGSGTAARASPGRTGSRGPSRKPPMRRA